MDKRILHEGEIKELRREILKLVEKGQIIPDKLVSEYNSAIYKSSKNKR